MRHMVHNDVFHYSMLQHLICNIGLDRILNNNFIIQQFAKHLQVQTVIKY